MCEIGYMAQQADELIDAGLHKKQIEYEEEQLKMKITLSEFKKALKFAKEAHQGQFRKDGKTPYIEHPKAVARSLIRRGTKTKIMISSALLHDVIEDTNFNHFDIRFRFGKQIADTIQLLSRVKGENYYGYINVIGFSKNIFAIEIKMEDLRHNMFDLEEGSKKDKYRFALDYLKKVRMEI
jgi:(p)ppGpp synthase/HD superfamily hydrolase